MNMKNIYKFSIIIPAYNVEQYIKECIESIINQEKVSFTQDVQVIIIDDGSIDSTGDIVKKYVKKYPNNIHYIEQKHKGVSSARNTGLNYAKGKYVNFLDSDDKLDSKALIMAYEFLEENSTEIDFVAIPIYFFEAIEGEHILNYKFNCNKIIDIRKEYAQIQLSAASTFIKKSAIGNIRFDINLRYAEDAKFINQVLLKKKKYGVIKKTKYFYRKRKNKTSTIQQIGYNTEWYIDNLKNFSLSIKELIKDNKEIEDYLQFIIMYDMQWRINTIGLKKNYLSMEERVFFLKALAQLLSDIKVKIILKQKNICIYRKLILLIAKFIYFNKIKVTILKKI